MGTPNENLTIQELLPSLILGAVLLAIIVFSIIMFIKTSKAKRIRKQETNRLKEQGLTIRATFDHVNGLPIAENLFCEIFSYPDRIEFKSGTTNIRLARSKITDMCVKADVDIQKQIVSSAGGAVAGGIMFGALGAAIGGRAKTKDVRTVTQYLIITYKNEQSQPAYIGFDATGNPHIAAQLVYEFKRLNTNQGISIEL